MDSQAITRALVVLNRKVSDLPEIAELWPQQPEGWRAGWMIEWDSLMARFGRLHSSYREGQMSHEQAQSYQGVARLLRDYLPLIRQLDFTLPSVSLDEDIAA